ncbi:MAG TPA: serine/threonine-protein kinase, partial [Myxococcota bacterium]
MARAPKSVGPYDIGDVLGKGGMGEVFRARHQTLDRQAALKRLVLPPDLNAADAEMWRERFLREGKALAKINHESIVAVFDLIEQRGDLWLALELVDGFDVSDLVRAGALPIDIACMIGLGVARALEAAHRGGVVHRDVKPQNIIVSKLGVVKLMDFGVARDESLDTLTKTGGVVGTPSYLAPEVLKGQPASHKSDVYALGAVLYELLSGRRLFAHATPETIWGLVATGKWPRLGKVAPTIPWKLTLLVERCLKLDPKRRPASASEVKQQLESFLANHS